MKKMNRRQVDKLFIMCSHDLYDKFIESAVILYTNLFPERCSSKTFDDAYYDLTRQRLMLELSVLFNEAKGEKNAKKKCCKDAAKRAVAK